MKWFLKAAEQNNEDAQYKLSLLYREGTDGIEKNEAEAEKWLTKSGRRPVKAKEDEKKNK